MTLLSIIIPVYNMEAYLEQCLSSLVLQDEALFNQLEVLVVNDGSTDGSRAIALNYQAKYPQTFRVIDKSNGNYGSCINVGLYLAQGTYVKVLDADDSFQTEGFVGLMQTLATCGADCVLTDTDQVHPDGSVWNHIGFDLPTGRAFGLEALGDAARNMWMHCVCYRLENLRAIFYHQTEGISYTDQEFICLPMSTMRSIVYYPKVVYRYLLGRDGQTVDSSVWERKFKEEIQGCRVMIDQERLLYPGCTPEGHAYIRLRIARRVEVIYDAYFAKFKTFSNNALMIEFDRYLKEYDPKLYQQMDEMRFCHFLYPVRSWRRDYKPDTAYLKLTRLLVQTIRRFRYGKA